MKPNYQKAEIVFVDLGTVPDQVKGHEQANVRPCLIISPINALELAIIVPFTSKPKSSLYSVVEVKKGNGGLKSDSYALCHQIRSVSSQRITKRVGVLPNSHFFKVLTVLSDLLDLPQ